ncbi:hypothetical protein [Myceligenerans crystallogenes]|uniref:Uncharacterized protein n=1 Tax=Myceligenerans crystallogenes TaxID=316335 RepID=A0ABN2N3G7_9MICO
MSRQTPGPRRAAVRPTVPTTAGAAGQHTARPAATPAGRPAASPADRPAASRADRPSASRAALLGATVASGVAALLGAGWLAGRLPGFYTDPANAFLAGLAGAQAATLVHTVAALLGVAAGIGALAGALRGRALAAAGALQVAVFGLAMGSLGTLSVVGYLLAFAMPVVIVVLVVQAIRKYPRARWFVGLPALAAVVAAVVVAGPAIPGALATSGAAVGADLWAVGLVLVLLAVATTWGAVAIRASAAGGAAGRLTAWVLRHRTAVTIVAATGPLPYALVRLSWLTPWPLVAPDDMATETRVWGLLLSGVAWAGFALTLGLIQRWGEVFPRWVPVLAGRPVPVAAAAVPGGFVAATLCFSAVPMLVAFAEQGEFWAGVFTFPCWYWGPALALAVWGYVAHRRGSGAAR